MLHPQSTQRQCLPMQTAACPDVISRSRIPRRSTHAPTRKPKLLDQLRAEIRLRHYSIRTERAYCDWVKRYCYFHGLRHPNDMGAREITAFLSHLAVRENVAASPQICSTQQETAREATV